MTTGTTPTTPSELLKCTVAVIRRRGLAKGKLVDDDGAVCVRGAMFECLTGDPHRWPQDGDDARGLWEMTEQIILEANYEIMWPHGIVVFNNMRQTTAATMIEALVRAERRA